MPIRFRCPKCTRLLGISRRKAGMDTVCPQCGATIRVPPPDSDGTDEMPAVRPAARPAPLPASADDTQRTDDPAAPPRRPRAAEETTQKAVRPSAAAAPAKKPRPPSNPGEAPLFEQMDFDELLGLPAKPGGPTAAEKLNGKPPVPGVDALSLDDGTPQPVVISPRKVTILVVAVVVLLAVAFVAGYLIATGSTP